MIDPKNIEVMEYSKSQKCLHRHKLDDHIRKNFHRPNDISNDWLIIASNEDLMPFYKTELNGYIKLNNKKLSLKEQAAVKEYAYKYGEEECEKIIEFLNEIA